jgi:hypothetical protein
MRNSQEECGGARRVKFVDPTNMEPCRGTADGKPLRHVGGAVTLDSWRRADSIHVDGLKPSILSYCRPLKDGSGGFYTSETSQRYETLQCIYSAA